MNKMSLLKGLKWRRSFSSYNILKLKVNALAGYTGLSFIRGLHVVPAALGADAGLIGAAALVSSVT